MERWQAVQKHSKIWILANKYTIERTSNYKTWRAQMIGQNMWSGWTQKKNHEQWLKRDGIAIWIEILRSMHSVSHEIRMFADLEEAMFKSKCEKISEIWAFDVLKPMAIGWRNITWSRREKGHNQIWNCKHVLNIVSLSGGIRKSLEQQHRN